MQMNTLSLLLTERGLDCFLLGILCSGSGRRRVIETSPSRRGHVTLHPDLTSKVTRKHNNGSVGATLVLDSRRRSRPDWRRFRRPRMRRRRAVPTPERHLPSLAPRGRHTSFIVIIKPITCAATTLLPFRALFTPLLILIGADFINYRGLLKR